MGESDGAVLALQLFAAGPAQHRKGIAAAVEQDNGLLSAIDGVASVSRDQTAREKMLSFPVS